MKWVLCFAAALSFVTPAFCADAPGDLTRTYIVEQAVTLSDIPIGSKLVKCWISIPSDDRDQEILDFSVLSPSNEWRIVREPDHGNRFLYFESAAPAVGTLTTKIDFTVRRRSTLVQIDPKKVGPMTASHRILFADELRQDAPHMEVTPKIIAMAEKSCGSETNIAVEAHALLEQVANFAKHYSRDPSVPKFSVGDADSCMISGGGTCTDIHSLFIALARSRGIPARLQMGYRLREANENKEVDPGYRCWVEYFLPGYGWIPADIVEAGDPKGAGHDRWFSGLTERRLWLNEGREFDFAGRANLRTRVNTMVIGYAEIDGVEARELPKDGKPAQFTRLVKYKEIKPTVVASTP